MSLFSLNFILKSSLSSYNTSILTDFLLFFKWLPKITPLTLPSAQGRQGHTHRIALRFPLSPTRGEGKEECVGDMNQNIFNDTDFSRFTSHFSLKTTASTTTFTTEKFISYKKMCTFLL